MTTIVPATAATGSSGPTTAGRRAGTAAAYHWELVKLAALVRVRAMIIGCLVAPPIIVLVLRSQRPPADTLYGKLIHLSGFAVPLLLLGFISQAGEVRPAAPLRPPLPRKCHRRTPRPRDRRPHRP